MKRNRVLYSSILGVITFIVSYANIEFIKYIIPIIVNDMPADAIRTTMSVYLVCCEFGLAIYCIGSFALIYYLFVKLQLKIFRKFEIN